MIVVAISEESEVAFDEGPVEEADEGEASWGVDEEWGSAPRE